MMMDRARGRMHGLITISILLIAISMIFLASSISLYANSLRTAGFEAARLETVSEQSDAAASAFRALLQNGAVNATVSSGSGGNQTNVSFDSDSANIAFYQADAPKLKQFLEANSGPGSLSINSTEAAIPRLYVRPYNISIDFTQGAVNATPQNNSASYGAITGYAVLLRINQPSLSLSWAPLSSVPPSSPDALFVSVGAQGADGGVSNYTYVNRSATSALLVKNGANATLATLNFTSTSKMILTYGVALSSKTTLLLNTTGASSAPLAELGTNIINVRLDDGTVAVSGVSASN